MDTNRVDQHVGSRLRQRRQSLRLSKATLGALVSLTEDQIADFEDGQKRISARMICQLSQNMDLPVAYFFDGYGR